MFATPGNMALNWCQSSEAIKSAFVNENYLVIGAHIDALTQQKIVNHEYVDFAKLLPRNRIGKEEDHQMELVNKGGSTYFVPVSDRESANIASFARWEKAFRIFSNIYTRFYPHKVTELILYNHVIYTASTTYVWENVYHYDKEFRMHLSNFPQRSWSVILQQAWAMYLKDRLPKDDSYRNNHNSSGSNFRHNGQHKFFKNKEICKRFNRGNCPNGFLCKYDHRCSIPICGKTGHGAHICRKRQQYFNQQNQKNDSAGATLQSNQSMPLQETSK